MRELRRSAAYRLAFGYTALCALAVLAIGLSVYYAASTMLRHDFDRNVREETAALQREYGEGGVPDVMDAITRHANRPDNGFRYALFNSDGATKLNDASLPRATPGWSEIRLEGIGRKPWHVRFLATHLAGGETLIVAADTRHLERLGGILLTVLGVGFVVILGLGAAGAALFGRHLRGRLEGISSTAQAIVAGDLEQRVSVTAAGDEFDRAGESLNMMLDRIAHLVENLRQVSSDVAHDLRTPLQRLHGAVEVGLNGPQQVESLRSALASAQGQSTAILALFEAILRICEVEAGGVRERFEVVDLAMLTRSVCEMYGPAFEDAERALACHSEGTILICGDRELLIQMIANLLDNAALHTPRGTSVVVSARCGVSDAQLIVADTGPGVSAADRERIIQRFVRLDRSRTTKGHGLGLNLVAAIASAHGGRLVIEDNYPGLRANICLPRAHADAPAISRAACTLSLPQ